MTWHNTSLSLSLYRVSLSLYDKCLEITQHVRVSEQRFTSFPYSRGCRISRPKLGPRSRRLNNCHEGGRRIDLIRRPALGISSISHDRFELHAHFACFLRGEQLSATARSRRRPNLQLGSMKHRGIARYHVVRVESDGMQFPAAGWIERYREDAKNDTGSFRMRATRLLSIKGARRRAEGKHRRDAEAAMCDA